MDENAFTFAHAMRHIRGCARTLLRRLLHDDDNDNKGMDIYGRGGIGVKRAGASETITAKGIERKKK
jgi:hypothetical protein